MWRENTTKLPNANSQFPTRAAPTRSVLLGSWELGVGSSLELPQFRELQEHGVRVHERKRETCGAVDDAFAENVVSEERSWRVQQEIRRPRPATALVHLLCRER